MKTINDRKHRVLVALQQALLGEVSSRLRAVTVLYDDNSVHFDCYYNGDISDEDREAMSCVETELIAALPETDKITHQVLRMDYPRAIPKDRTWVFFRKEDGD
jgi:hypothetical protein